MLHTIYPIMVIWMVVIPSSFSRKTRITETPEEMIDLKNPKYKTYNDIAAAMKAKEMEWIKLEDTFDLNQARNVMTTAIYALGGEAAKATHPYGMFLKKGSFNNDDRLKLQKMDGYDINVKDKNNPGRLLMDKGKRNIFKYAEGKVPLYINIPPKLAMERYGDTEKKDGVDVGKGGWQWAWIDPAMDVNEKIGGEKIILFPFRERVLGNNKKTGMTEEQFQAEIMKNAGIVNKAKNVANMAVSAVKKRIPKWMKKKETPKTENNVMGMTPKTGKTNPGRIDYYDYMEGDEWYYDDYDDDLYDEYMELLKEERALDRLLRAYGDDSDESDDDDSY